MIIDGKKLQEEKINEFSKSVLNIKAKLKLVVVQVGNNAASNVYINNKKTMCEKVGILFELLKYDTVSKQELVDRIKELNTDESVTGILVQLPLPKEINANEIINTIDPLKDVDGLTVLNKGTLFSGEKGLVPCTALGVMEILKSIDVNIEGLDVVVVGRSSLVGLPLLKLLLDKNATVTVCHSKTNDLKEKTTKADILIVAAGEKHLIKKDFVKDGAVVVDVGINREDGKLYGDCDFDNIKDKCKYITPVPKGVGPLTIAMLISNIISAYYLQKNK